MRKRLLPGGLAMTSLALSLALAACSGIPADTHDAQADPQPKALPRLSPATPAQQTPQLAIDRWWLLFDDAALHALVSDALQHNHDLALAAARVNEARAQLDGARGAQKPQLDLQNQSGRSRQPGEGRAPGTPLIGERHQVSLVAQYELDLWGRLAAGSAAARQRLLAQEWARAAVQWSLTAQLAEAHFGLRAVQRQIEITEAVRTSRGRTVGLRQQEHAAGIASEFDLRRAEAELAGTDANLTSLQRQRVALEGTLSLLSGRPVDTLALTEAARAPLDTTQAFAARLPQGDVATMLVQRPDLRQAEARLTAARADIRAARAAALPVIRLNGLVGSDVLTLSKAFTGTGFVWSVATSATQSIFDAGRAGASVREANARADAALAQYRQAVLVAGLEVREAYAGLALTQQAQRAEHERVSALERARRLAEIGHQSGAIGQLDLLDAERNAYQAQLNEVAATRDLLVVQVAAFKALGGGLALADSQARGGLAGAVRQANNR